MTTTEQPPKPGGKRPGKKKAEPQDWGSPERMKGEAIEVAVAAKKWYWCGTFPTCPTAFVNVGSATFSAVTVTKRMTKRGDQISKPMAGNLMYLSKVEVQAIAEAISRSVVRFHEPMDEYLKTAEEDGREVETDGVDMLHQFRRRGVILRKKTVAEVEAIAKKGGPDYTYTAKEFDEPLSDHIYMIPCSNQKKPRAEGESMHDVQPISVTGIEWPE